MKKDIEWVISEIEQRVEEIEAREETTPYSEGVVRGLEVSLFLIDELDEPEVLSQELPVIPDYVAERIEKSKENKLELGEVFSGVFTSLNLVTNPTEDLLWIRDNQDLFARAWLDGFTVAGEQKYRISLHDGTWLVSDYNRKISKATTYFMHQEDRGFMNRVHEFTEQQINNVDTKYMSFAVKVEELEK